MPAATETHKSAETEIGVLTGEISQRLGVDFRIETNDLSHSKHYRIPGYTRNLSSAMSEIVSDYIPTFQGTC